MTLTGDQQEQELQQEDISVGDQLRAARERSGFDQKEIARELKLDLSVISALENNDFERLPEPIFVCGYLRAYANLVSIPSDPLVAAFTNRGYQPPPIARQKPAKTQVSSRDTKVRGVSIGIALVLVVLLITWWRGNSLDITDTAPVPEAEEETTPLAAGVGAEPDTATDSVAREAAPAPASVQPLPPARVETAVERPVAVAAQPDETPAATPAPATIIPAGPQSRVVMMFAADSWVEIEDAAGNKLVYDLMREGRSHELTGVAPFKVFLGNAPGVKIEYNGKPFDFTPYIRGDLAHFRLGRSNNAITADGNVAE